MSKKDFLRYSKITVSSAIFLIFFVLTATVILFEKQQVSWRNEIQIGEPAPRDIFAPVSFEVPNNEATQRLKRSLQSKLVPVYTIDARVIENKEQILKSFFEEAELYRKAGEKNPEEIAEKYSLSISEVKALSEIKDWPREARPFEGLLLGLLKKGIFDDQTKENLLRQNRNAAVLIKIPGVEELTVFVKSLPSQKEVFEEYVKPQIRKLAKHNRDLESLWSALSREILVPDLLFDEIETERRRKKIEDETPSIMDLVKKNQILVGKGKLVTHREYQQILEAGRELAKQRAISHFIAKVLLIMMTYGIFALYIFLFENRIFLSLKNLCLVNSAVLITVVLERIAFLMPESLIYFVLPASLATLLLSILVNYRIALVGAVLVAILTSVMSGFKPDITLFALFGGTAGIFAMAGLKKRAQFIKVGALIGIVNFTVLFSYWIFHNVSLRGSIQLGALGLANGFLMSVLIFFLLFFFEKVFKVTTDITLLELSDLNHPLLKRMVVEAPGTYHHTLMISNLCEGAAEAIGANSLLARVGAYFHDIGKLASPTYYAENEAVEKAETEEKETSLHDALLPARSKEIIMDHVEKGIELGKKYKLPQVILDFIPEHHGNGVVYYFYHKAKKQQKPGEAKVREEDYRYKGPKPQSKETAIALLADSVEATTRTLSDHSSESLSENVKKIINEKFTDGQLDECPLTLHNLETIAESFVRTLTGIYHKRVQYPEKDEDQKKPKPFSS